MLWIITLLDLVNYNLCCKVQIYFSMKYLAWISIMMAEIYSQPNLMKIHIKNREKKMSFGGNTVRLENKYGYTRWRIPH